MARWCGTGNAMTIFSTAVRLFRTKRPRSCLLQDIRVIEVAVVRPEAPKLHFQNAANGPAGIQRREKRPV